MQRVGDVQTVWYTGWNSGMAWGEVVWLRGGYGPAWWNCVLWISSNNGFLLSGFVIL